MTPVRVLLAEDHPMFRDGLTALLDGDARFEVVAAVADTGAALDAIGEAVAVGVPIDVAVLDLAMPGGGGLVACRGVRDLSPDTRVLVLTSADAASEVLAALDSGAHGYLLKSATPEEILAAVAVTAAGGAALSDDALLALSRRRGSADRTFPELTDRETAVLVAMAQGLDNPAIAHRLGLSDKTVRNYVSAVLVKLQVTHRTAAVAEAHRRGLGADG